MAVCAEKGKEMSSLAMLDGTWRLIYSSSFAKEGAPPSILGSKLGQVPISLLHLSTTSQP